MPQSIVSRYFKSLPIIFPLIGLFHLVMTLIEAYFYVGDQSVHAVYTLRPVLLGVYTLLWVILCFKKRWAAIAYLILAMANTSLQLFGNDDWLVHRALGDILFEPLPINLVFCFLILFYYRKLK